RAVLQQQEFRLSRDCRTVIESNSENLRESRESIDINSLLPISKIFNNNINRLLSGTFCTHMTERPYPASEKCAGPQSPRRSAQSRRRSPLQHMERCARRAEH